MSDLSDQEYETGIAELIRLLREAFERSLKSGDLTAEEIAWRADVRFILGDKA